MNYQKKLEDLQSRYDKALLDKRELAKELNVSVSSISNNIAKGVNIPNYVKLGNAKNASVRFSIVDVAEFISNSTYEIVA